MSMVGLFMLVSLGGSLFVRWSGVDESVVEKFAKEAGREPWTPFINTNTGDLLLFVFLLAGIAGGFAMGYFYRKLFVEKS